MIIISTPPLPTSLALKALSKAKQATAAAKKAMKEANKKAKDFAAAAKTACGRRRMAAHARKRCRLARAMTTPRPHRSAAQVALEESAPISRRVWHRFLARAP